MSTFIYKAKQGPQKILSGTLDAQNINAAVERIMELGLVPVDVKEIKGELQQKSVKFIEQLFNQRQRVTLNDKNLFTQQMSDLVDAAVPILRALQIVISQTRNLYFKDVLNEIYQLIKDGESLSEALARYPHIFSSLYINVIKTGEVSGQLEVVLKRLAEYFEQERIQYQRVQNSLAYPLLIMIVGTITIFILLTFVFPRIALMFEDMGQALPLATRMIIVVSHFLATFWWLIVILLISGGIYLKQILGSPHGRRSFDRWILTVPLLGNFIRVAEIGRFSRTMATMLETGVPMTLALNSVEGTITHQVLREEIKKVSQDVAHGQSFKNALQKCSFFTEMTVSMISVGEETGHLEQALHKVAESYEREADEEAKRMISWLGPLTLILVVMIVGFVVIAMLLPILSMNLAV